MQLTYPLTFDLMGLTRNLLWGGGKLKRLVPNYPEDTPLAEIWVISDRPEDGRIGMVSNGPLAGVSLTELMAWSPSELLGKVKPMNGKFPLLIKFLDTNDAFSLQVHPDDSAAKELNAESKTEFWAFLAGTDPGTYATAGLKHGVTREHFEQTLRSGDDLAPLLHTVPVRDGDCLYVRSGRIHSMSKGALIYEVQENSNTTYRVFDWNRIDVKTGKPRALHVDNAIVSIDFHDFEPNLQKPCIRRDAGATVEELVDTPYFTIERWTTSTIVNHRPAEHGSFEVLTVLEDSAEVSANNEMAQLSKFGTSLIPAAAGTYCVKPKTTVTYLRTFVRA